MGFVYLVLEYIFWMQYEDPVGQEAARKTVPICELEEKALVSLAKVSLWSFFSFVPMQDVFYDSLIIIITSISLSRFS